VTGSLEAGLLAEHVVALGVDEAALITVEHGLDAGGQVAVRGGNPPAPQSVERSWGRCYDFVKIVYKMGEKWTIFDSKDWLIQKILTKIP
jgi:hypothetical protein